MSAAFTDALPRTPDALGILGGMAMAQVVLARNSGAAVDDEGNLKSYKALYHKVSLARNFHTHSA